MQAQLRPIYTLLYAAPERFSTYGEAAYSFCRNIYPIRRQEFLKIFQYFGYHVI